MTYDAFTKYDAAVAGSYDEDRQDEAHWREEQRFMSGYASSHRLGKVLDLPVGTGRFLEYYVDATSVVGVDISDDMLRMARAKAAALGGNKTMLAKGDATALSYGSGSFDTAVCFRLAHLLPPEVLPRLFAELARVTNGTVLVQVYAGVSPKTGWSQRVRAFCGRLLRPLLKREPKPWSHIQSYSHPKDSLVDVAREAGLTLVRTHPLSTYTGLAVEVLEFSTR